MSCDKHHLCHLEIVFPALKKTAEECARQGNRNIGTLNHRANQARMHTHEPRPLTQAAAASRRTRRRRTRNGADCAVEDTPADNLEERGMQEPRARAPLLIAHPMARD